MSETPGQQPASAFDPAAGAATPSAGTLLRLAREEAGLHVATLASALKVPVRKLESLEADRFDELPDAVFTRALAASVCRTLKIDPAPILQRLPATGSPRLGSVEGRINAPFRSPRDGAGPSWRYQLTRPVFLVVAALLVGALVVVLLPLRQEGGDAVEPPPVAVVPAPEMEPVVAAPAAPEPVVATAATTPQAPPGPLSRPPAAVVAPKPVAAPQPAADGIVVFKARAPTWVQVTDAKGAVPLRKLLAAGESAAASGALPLAVTVGSANATDVVVRGKPFDLAPLARDNVARFEVK